MSTPSTVAPCALALLAITAACASDGGGAAGSTGTAAREGPALDVRLVVDPNQTTQADLAQRLTSIVVIVDADQGLYRAGEETSEGPIQVKNADADPDDLELVATLDVDGAQLPSFRLERGGLDDVAVDLRVLGFVAGKESHVVEGSLRAARFGDSPTDVALPFLLRASELPPRVVDVLPADGASIPGCELPSLTLVFSRPIDAASLAVVGGIDISSFGPPTEVSLDASGLVATLATEGLQGVDDAIRFRVMVGEAVRAAEGGPALDQAPAEAGAQGYVADLTLTCTPPPVMPCGPEGGGADCPKPCGEQECTPDPRITCRDDACVLSGCPEPCPEGALCDPASGGCVLDCRLVGVLDGCAPPSQCDSGSGLCRYE